MLTREQFNGMFPDLKKCKTEDRKILSIRKTLTKGYGFMYSGAEYENKMSEAEKQARDLYQQFGRS